MRLLRLFLISLLLLGSLSFTIGSFSNQAMAQNASVPTPVEEKRTPTDPAEWKTILDEATAIVEGEDVTDAKLDKIIASTTIVRDDSGLQISQLQPRLDEISQQLTELGKEPEKGEPEESAEAQLRRSSLNKQFAELDAQVKAARLAFVRSQQIQKSVVQVRQSKFFSSISVRSKGVFTFSFWSDFIGGIPSYVSSFNAIIIDGLETAGRELSKQSWKYGFIPFLILALSYFFVRARRLLTTYIVQDTPDDTGMVYRSRFIEFCRNGLLPVLFIFLLYRIFWDGFLLTPRVGQFVASVSAIASFYIMALALLRIVLLPREGRRRILLLNDLPARRIVNTMTIGLAIAGVIAVLNAIAIVIVSRLSIAVGLSFLFSLTISITFLITIWHIHKDRDYNDSLSAIVEYTKKWQLAKLIVHLSTVTIFISAILGYIAFSEFLAQQLVFGLIVVGTVWLILRFVHNIAAPAIKDATNQTGQSNSADAVSERQTGQMTILVTGLLTLVLYLAAAILLLLPWGYRTSDFYQVIESIFFGFEIGGLRFSFSTILIVVGLFIIGYTVTVSLRNWLNNKLLPTTALDVGVSNSISTIFGYIGFVLAAILAVSVAGFDLSNLAIVAGALSVGVGFGLQSIVNNFVSGLILLAERPIKAGDWIVTAGGEGTVTKISVRSTEIETFDRATVIIPNSTLITDNVTNWTHENKTGRIIIPVGVAYGSNVERVREILLDCAKAQRLVLGRPEPVVFLMDFGASSLDFQLRCFLADINHCLTVSSELRFAILEALNKEGIEIPFPQTDLHIRSGLPQPPTRASKNKTQQ